MSKALVANQLSKTFGEAHVVRDVSFDIERGEVLALLGPNGAGKTTTVKMILGLITPTAGQAFISGLDMAKATEAHEAATLVGAVLEGARNLYWRLSPLENLRYFGALRGMPRKNIDSEGTRLLEQLGLADKRNVEVRTFSRGMQQKVALAVALIHNPQVLILDEPTLGLDVEAAQQLEQTIIESAAQGKAILLTSHNMPLVERLANRIVIIKDGRAVRIGEKQEILNDVKQQSITDIRIKGDLTPLKAKIYERFPNVTINEKGSHLVWHDPEQAEIIELYGLLDGAGIEVEHIAKREPTLEEAFLQLVGSEVSEL